jgi:uncharacterized protein with ATP-grasp and redox domains
MFIILVNTRIKIAPHIFISDILARSSNDEELWGDNDDLLGLVADGVEIVYLCDNPGKIYF